MIELLTTICTGVGAMCLIGTAIQFLIVAIFFLAVLCSESK